MTSKIYLDEITQSFVSDGNVFLRLVSVTGDLDSSGKDIKDTSATLVIPLVRFAAFAKNVGVAADLYVPSQSTELQPMEPAPTELLGEVGLPLFVPN